jgi:uncharacterized protein (DUF736 family)
MPVDDHRDANPALEPTENDMPQIGTFKSDGVGYSGQLHTLTSEALLTLEPNRQAGPNGPAFRVFHATSEVGIAFKPPGKDSGKPYLLVLVDDLSVSNSWQAARGASRGSSSRRPNAHGADRQFATVCPSATDSGVWPSSDAWLRAVL